jgi:hypothetical protein
MHLSFKCEPQGMVQHNAADQADDDASPRFDSAPLGQQDRSSD